MWNMMQYQHFSEQNAFNTTAKIGILCEEKEAALKERDRAISETKAILKEMEFAIKQRDLAIIERNNALKERDNAIAALQFHESNMHIPISEVPTSRAKASRNVKIKSTRSSKKAKKMGEDLNRQVTTYGSKAEWEDQDLGSTLQMIRFDESTMPVPVCSCTGVARQCYKWGKGGWQSSCCTTALSEYPLPQMPNKRHARMGGRKMSGSVFSRLLTRLGTGGHDLSIPLDLKNYWAKHGTNRYITIT
ncbi:hypothetical protein ACP275_14G125500 [Erythranthe tilingii]